MADYFTKFAFAISAARADAERVRMLVEATTTLEESGAATLTPEIEPAFATPTASGATITAGIFEDNPYFGIDCQFDEPSQTLAIFDRDGSPALWPLAQCLQRLLPAKLPFRFVYAQTCSKHRTDGFGGGLFAIGHDCIVQKSLDEALAEEVDDLTEFGDG